MKCLCLSFNEAGSSQPFTFPSDNKNEEFKDMIEDDIDCVIIGVQEAVSSNCPFLQCVQPVLKELKFVYQPFPKDPFPLLSFLRYPKNVYLHFFIRESKTSQFQDIQWKSHCWESCGFSAFHSLWKGANFLSFKNNNDTFLWINAHLYFSSSKFSRNTGLSTRRYQFVETLSQALRWFWDHHDNKDPTYLVFMGDLNFRMKWKSNPSTSQDLNKQLSTTSYNVDMDQFFDYKGWNKEPFMMKKGLKLSSFEEAIIQKSSFDQSLIKWLERLIMPNDRFGSIPPLTCKWKTSSQIPEPVYYQKVGTVKMMKNNINNLILDTKKQGVMGKITSLFQQTKRPPSNCDKILTADKPGFPLTQENKFFWKWKGSDHTLIGCTLQSYI